MRALVSLLARAGFAVALALTALALLRWAPVFAQPPVDVRAMPVFPFLLGFGVLAAWTARPEPRPRLLRPLVIATVGVALLLVGLVGLRGEVGVAALQRLEAGGTRRLPAGPIDLTPADLAGQRGPIEWTGTLRVPRSGSYRIWAKGRGRVELRIQGRSVLAGEGEDLEVASEVRLGRGERPFELRYEPTGSPEARAARIRGHRLRLGWLPPRADGSPGSSSDLILPRYLGGAPRPVLWAATDALAALLAALVGLLAFAGRWERPTRAPAPGRVGRAELPTAALAYALLLAIMSWPLVSDLAGLGVIDRADGRLNAWILGWDAHALLTAPLGVFDAPVFHPARDTLAFSENLLLPALLALPAIRGGGVVLGYNLIFLGSAIGSGLGVLLLVRRASGDRVAAFVAGALFAAGAHRWSRIAHLHAQLTLFLPFVLLALDRFWERRTFRNGLVLGVVLALQAWSSIYLGVIAATALALLVALGLAAGLAGRELWRLAAGLALTGLLVAPVLLPYLDMRESYGAEWSLADVEPHMVTLPSYLGSGTAFYASLTERHLDPELRRRPLFPGVIPLALGVAGLAGAPPRFRRSALLMAAAAVVLSLGPETALYRWLHDHVLLLRGIRAVNRFALLPVLALCVLAGFALAGRRRLAWLALLLGLAEAADLPLRLEAYRGPSAAARWLAGRSGAVAVLPLGERDSEAMLDALGHFRPLLNGYSGFTPPHYRWLPDALEEPAAPDSLRLLRGLGVTELVAREPLPLPMLARFEEQRVYAVPPGVAARACPAPDRPAPALWTSGAATLDLGRSQAFERVTFEIADALPETAPRVELSDDGASFRDAKARLDVAGAVMSLAASPRRGFAELRFDGLQRARFVRVSRVPALPGGSVGVE